MKPAIICGGCGLIVEIPTTGGSGYGETADGRRLCYDCCNAAERAAFETADTFCAYLSGDGAAVTTWPGGRLATVTYKRRHSGGFGGEWWAVDATAPDGSKWHGRGGGPGMFLRLKRRKTRRA